EIGVLAGRLLELQPRVAGTCELDHAAADVDADADAGPEGSEKVAGAAADLEHRRSGLDDCLADGRDEVVVAARAPGPAVLGRRELVEGLRDRLVRLAPVDGKRSS